MITDLIIHREYTYVKSKPRGETLAYVVGKEPAHYPVPATTSINPLIHNWICRDIYRWLWSHA